MGLGALIAALDELAGADPAELSEPDTVVELHRQQQRLAAITTRATGRFDTDRAWQTCGARSAASWLAVRGRIPNSAAKHEIGLARALRHLPACETAWLAGDIGAAHVRAVARVRRPATEARLAEDEAMLIGHAKTLGCRGFARVMAYWAQHADPDGEDDNADAQRARRNWYLSQSFDGLWFANAVFDPISGTIVAGELARIETELFHADWAEAKTRLGREPTTADLARTAAQRRADALVEMAIRSRTAPADGRRPEPLFTILAGWETTQGRILELANGSVVAPAAVVPWLESAWLERVVFDGPSRVIDVGVAQRLYTGATRRAVEVRDRQCFHEYCDITADHCQVDHIIPYAIGGPTTQNNGRLACGHHNRNRHTRPQPDP
jgi:hypothetical protein